MFDRDRGFFDFNQYVDEAHMDLTTQPGEYNITFPINFLEDALGGMVQSELVVIAADSGVGKTELVNKIAFHNTIRKKNVYIFSLEGDKYDFINRYKYELFCEYLTRTDLCGAICSYREFLINKIPKEGKSILIELDDMIKTRGKTLKVYNREEDLSLERFEAHLDLINDQADLVIIDHLHYFDFHKKEYEAINEIMKRIKKIQERYRIPIILVSHLRKKDKLRTFPDQEDFHGSSNIVKQADTCIVMAHVDLDDANAKDQITSNIYKTGIRIVKSRTGFSQKLVGVVDYKIESRAYSDNYSLMVCGNNYMDYIEKLPRWAKRANKPVIKDAKNEG